MNKTKKQPEDVREQLRKKIEEDKARIASINSEIATTKAEIGNLSAKINNFSDDNVSEFNELKAKKADAESRVVLLERQKKSLTNPAKETIREDYGTIENAKKEIFDRFAKELAPLIEQLRTLCESTDSDLNQLRDLHQLWVNAYSLSDYRYTSLDTLNNAFMRTKKFLSHDEYLKTLKPY